MTTQVQAAPAGEPAASEKPSYREQFASIMGKAAESQRQAVAPSGGFIAPAEAVSAMRDQAGEPDAKSESPADVEPVDESKPDAPDTTPSPKAEAPDESEGEPEDPDLSSLGLSPEELEALRGLGFDTSKLGESESQEGEPEGSDPFADLSDEERAPYAEFGGDMALMSREIHHLRQGMAKREQNSSELVDYVKELRKRFDDFRGGRSFDETAARAQIKEALLDEGLDEESGVFKDALEYRISKAKSEFDSTLPPDIPEVEEWVERVKAERERAKKQEDQRMQSIWDSTVELSKRGTNGEELPLLQQYIWQAYTEKPTSDGRVLLARATPALEKEMARHLLAAPIVGDELKAALRVRAAQLGKRPPAKFTPGSATESRTIDEPSALVEDKVRRTQLKPTTGNDIRLTGGASSQREQMAAIIRKGQNRKREQDRQIFG